MNSWPLRRRPSSAHAPNAGECVRVCPVVPFSAAANAPAGEVVGGIIDFLGRQGELRAASDAWASTCKRLRPAWTIPICPEGINPRKMLGLAKRQIGVAGVPKTPELFRQMSRAIKIMVADAARAR
jgi:hypothetical protein